jgi:uroporphyrinogen-III synthase
MENVEAQSAKRLPLAGWRIIVSRARKQASVLAEGLRAQGASVLEIPFIEIRPPRSTKLMDNALRLISEYEWLILTSVNGVEALFERMRMLAIPHSSLAHLKFAAIGPATRAAIEGQGFTVEITPKQYIAEAVVEAVADQVRGKRVLLWRARIARDVIPRELRKLGAHLDVVEAYQTVAPKSSRDQLRAALNSRDQRPDAITFTSSSTVRNYVNLLAIRSGNSKLLSGILNISIGPITSATLREYNLNVDVQARQYTIPGLIEALIERAKSADRRKGN